MLCNNLKQCLQRITTIYSVCKSGFRQVVLAQGISMDCSQGMVRLNSGVPHSHLCYLTWEDAKSRSSVGISLFPLMGPAYVVFAHGTVMAPRISVSRDVSRSYLAFPNVALAVKASYLCYILLVKTSIKPHTVWRRGNRSCTSWWKDCQRIWGNVFKPLYIYIFFIFIYFYFLPPICTPQRDSRTAHLVV